MTKAATKAQRRKRKGTKRDHEAAGIPELAPSRKRDKSGCYQDRIRQQGDREVEPRETVLAARARHLGRPTTKEGKLQMAGQMFGDLAGQAIIIGSRNQAEADRLWDVFTKLDGADAAYHSRILGRGRHAKCGKVEFMPDRFEVRPDESSDYRTEEEKDRHAVNGWMRWHGHVGHLHSHEQTAIWNGVYLRCDLQRGGSLTTAGSAFVAALRMLADIYDKRSAA